MNYFFTEQVLLFYTYKCPMKATPLSVQELGHTGTKYINLSTHKKSCSNLLSLHCKLLAHRVDQSVDAIQAKDYC